MINIMTSDKTHDMAPLKPKKPAAKIYILRAILVLLTANLAIFFSAAIFNGHEGASNQIFFFLMILLVLSLSLIFIIFSKYKINYSMRTPVGGILLITTNLYFIFGHSDSNPQFSTLLMLIAFTLLMPTIIERICQFEPTKTKSRIIKFAYSLFIIRYFLTIFGLLFLINTYTSLDFVLPSKILCAIFSLLLLMLWMMCIKNKIRLNSSSPSCALMRISHIIILMALYSSIIYLDGNSQSNYLLITSLCLGGVLAYYLRKDSRSSGILNRVGLILSSIILILHTSIFAGHEAFADIAPWMMTLLILITMLFLPLWLLNYRRAMLDSYYPENKIWITICMLLSIPAATFCYFMFVFFCGNSIF